VVSNIERHTNLLRNEVTLQHIKEEYEARIKSLAHFEKELEFQELQKFELLKTRVSARLYDDRLDWLLNRSFEGSSTWLVNDATFLEWLDISNSDVPLLWLKGIPGAGKCGLSLSSMTF
jgi:hypothetical protein